MGKRQDITGRVYNSLTVLEYSHSDEIHQSHWLCECECGNKVVVAISSLKNGHTKSCGCLRKNNGRKTQDLIGKTYGKLLVVERAESKGRLTRWKCLCECGNETVVYGGDLKRGKVKSCGCLRKEVAHDTMIKYLEDKHGEECIRPHYSKKCQILNCADEPRLSQDNDKRLYAVYKHTCPNGKVYIGITCLDVQERWRHNGKGYKSQFFYRAINKYGWDNIKHEILYSGLSKNEAEKKEYELIALHKSNSPEHGYNIDNGGKTGGRMSEATKEKLRKINLEKNKRKEESTP